MESAIRSRRPDDRWLSGRVVKKAILPTFCFAVLSTIAFEEAVYAAQSNPAQVTNATAGTTKYININSGTLNLRAGASTSTPVIASLTKGTSVTVLSEANGWATVKVNGKTGYVSSLYLSSTNQNTGSNQASAVKKYVNLSSGSLNLRTDASIKSSVIGTLPKGTAVTVYSISNGWAKVNANGKNGYVCSSFLSSANPNAGIASPENTSVTTSKSNSSATSTTVSAVTKYVNVSSGSLNMRNGASASASIITKLAKGTSVTVYSEAGGWSKIVAYGHTGYVSSQYLAGSLTNSGKSVPVQQTVSKYVCVDTGTTLSLRKSASAASAVLAKLSNGTELTVYSETNGWAKVKVNGQDGYVSSDFISATKNNANNTTQQTTVTKTKYVNVGLGSSLNLRKYATTNSSVLIQLARGVAVTVYSETDGWSKINVYGQDGYVNSDYLSAAKPVAGSDTSSDNSGASNGGTNAEKFVNVIYGSSLNMRSTASTSAAVVTKLARGTIVTVLSEANGWAKVSANGQTGYVSSQYLSANEPVNPNTGSSTSNITYDSYHLSLSDMIKIQSALLPQTDKKYDTYISSDALTLTSTTSGKVNGSGWNVRGGAGTNYWVVGQVNNQDTLQILAKVKDSAGNYWYKVTYNKTWVNASPDDIAYYLNPDNFVNSSVDSLQFLKLSAPASIDATEVNSRILAGKGSLQGMASAFISAGNTYGINEIYLISHALLETGNGTSRLANGVQFNNKTVYNMYGIGAIDSNPVESGAQYAYNAGWFTPEAAIIGGAQFIAKGYIDAGQDTLYKMRWNPDSTAANGTASHQYATDIGWAEKQVNVINNLYSLLDSYKLILEIPQYQ